MLIRNKSDLAREVDFDDRTLTVEPGDAVEVPDEVANGRAPSGKKSDPNYDPGTTGLLAHEDVWETTKSRKSTADKATSEENA